MKIYSLLCCIFLSFQCYASENKKRIQQLEKQFDFNYAIQYIDSVLLQTEYQFGENHIKYDELLYEKIVILESFHKNEAALNLVKELRSKNIPPFLEAKLAIQLSLIYEKISFFDDCFIALDNAKQIIEEHQLNELKPFYFLRLASAYRVSYNYENALKNIDSALVYGIKFNNLERLAHIYLVKAYLENNSIEHTDKSLQSMKKAATIAHKIKDYKIYLFANKFLLNWYFSKYQIDTSLIYARKCLKLLENNSKYDIYYSDYNTISQVYQYAQKTDSALYIKKRGELAQININQQNTQAEIESIVTHFQNDVHQVELKKHKNKLDVQSFKLKKLYYLTALFLLLSVLTFYLYIRTKKLLTKNVLQQEEIKTINQTLQNSLENELFLTKELHHRVKNNLQIIIGLLDLQEEDFIEVKSINKQIFSIAAGHELLYREGLDSGISIKTYLNELVNYIIEAGGVHQKTNVQINSQDFHLDLDSIIPIGLMVNELLSNSVKHAQTSNNNLLITLELKRVESELKLTYTDNGNGFTITNPKFGSLVIQAMVQQLRGHMNVSTLNGAHYSFTLYV